MGLLLLSLVLAGMIGCLVWLGVGDRFPRHSIQKWESWQNIALYTLMAFLPLYLMIFFTF